MDKNCGWIITGKKYGCFEYVTSCNHVTVKHKYYVYCPYCGKVIKVLKEGTK